ncbi:oxidoreductase [Streptomyces sp. NPDC006784]|uniref:oxidoreductase n=1 Tax=Streptomyces sp. NPDC006784 TaxID=3364764 RepID=UPI0036C0085E
MADQESGEPPEGLTAAETGLWHAYRNGNAYDLRVGDPARDDAHGDIPWGPERTVRARVISLLLLGGPPPVPGRAPALKLAGCRLTGPLDLSNSEITVPFELRHCRLEEPLRLVDCRAGTVILHRCRIPRLEAERLAVTGDLRLTGSELVHGLLLAQARIGADLALEEVRLGSVGRGRALDADGLSVTRDVAADLLRATGELTLRAARVGGAVSLRGCLLRHSDGGPVLTAPRLTVEEDFVLAPAPRRPGGGSPSAPDGRPRVARLHGGVQLDGSTFGGALDFQDADLELAADQEFSLRSVQAAELRFTPRAPERGRVVLQDASVRRLVDRPDSWPSDGRLVLRGFTYEQLAPGAPFPLARRLAWVRAATPEFAPEPYDRLAACLQAGGEDADAHTVLLTKLRRRRRTLPLPFRAWEHVQDAVLGYGYRPGRAVLWLGLLLSAGTVWFARNPPAANTPGEGPHWVPAIYTLDLLLPVLDLGQETAWRPAGLSQWAALALVVLGWLLATIVTAGAAAVVLRRN